MPAPPSQLSTSLAGIPLASPLILAAGTAGTIDEMSGVLDLSRIGAVVSKSITPEPREGNSVYRVMPAPAGLGMLNAIGLANPGVDAFVRDYLPRAAHMPCPVIVSIAGFSIEDYAAVASRCASGYPHGYPHAPRGLPSQTASSQTHAERGGTHQGHVPAAIELNLSCPNVKHGTEFGASPSAAADVVRAVRAVAPAIPLFVKLSPVAPDIASIARAVVEAGATGLTLGNTIPALAIDVETRRPLLANITGGLSGPAIHAASLRAVWEVFSKFGHNLHGSGSHLPIIGLGGVSRWQDAAEFILAGASAVALGTALFAHPRVPLQINKGLAAWVSRQRAANIADLVGTMRTTA